MHRLTLIQVSGEAPFVGIATVIVLSVLHVFLVLADTSQVC
jgi:hypothetical protein